jgi:hypothetical protein
VLKCNKSPPSYLFLSLSLDASYKLNFFLLFIVKNKISIKKREGEFLKSKNNNSPGETYNHANKYAHTIVQEIKPKEARNQKDGRERESERVAYFL